MGAGDGQMRAAILHHPGGADGVGGRGGGAAGRRGLPNGDAGRGGALPGGNAGGTAPQHASGPPGPRGAARPPLRHLLQVHASLVCYAVCTAVFNFIRFWNLGCVSNST